MKFRHNLNALKFFRRCFNWSARQCETAVGRHGEIVTVLPDGTPKGSVVLSYHTDPWIYPDCRATHYHTNRWECGLIGDTFVEAGYRLDVVEHNNPHFRPPADTAFAIDLEQNLERYSRQVAKSCVKIHHASTTHWTHWNLAELTRLHAIQQRRGVTLVPRRQIPPNLAHEVADRAARRLSVAEHLELVAERLERAAQHLALRRAVLDDVQERHAASISRLSR